MSSADWFPSQCSVLHRLISLLRQFTGVYLFFELFIYILFFVYDILFFFMIL